MKILILGGTGAIGTHLCDFLSEDIYSVSVTTRSFRKDYGAIKFIKGNAKEKNFLFSLLESKWDVIIDFMIYENDEFKERLQVLLSSTSQYVYLSSARVYDDSQEFITEDCTRLFDTCHDKIFISSNEYAISKAVQEDLLTSSNHRNWTVIRPYITYGEERIQLGVLEKESWLYRALKGRTIVFSEDIKQSITTLTYGSDVAKAIAKIIGDKNALGHFFHITSKYAYSWADILEVYLDVIKDATGKKPNVLFQKLSDFMLWSPVKYPVLYDRLYDRKFDNTKINSYISTELFIDPKKGLRKCLISFIRKPTFKNISWRGEAIKDSFCGEFTPLSEISEVRSKIIYLVFRYIPWLGRIL